MTKEITDKKNFRLLKALMLCFIIATGFGLFALWYNINSVDSQSYKDSKILIDKCIAKHLNKNTYDLTEEDFLSIDSLVIDGSIDQPIYTRRTIEIINYDALDLRPLTILKNLRVLELKNVTINNFKPLGKLKSLEVIKIELVNSSTSNDLLNNIAKNRVLNKLLNKYSNKFRPLDLSTIKKAKNLKVIRLRNNNISNFNTLAKLINLTSLELSGTYIDNIQFIKNLKQLEHVHIAEIYINDISPLTELSNLKTLHLAPSHLISERQIEELQNALPELEISR